ncbi:MAG TPA: ABC transporter substrate-binding protein [Dehalococcoidia bacterium]|nr:ABC transporter substrate-binding protein [Dehalococcoidia bacterium]
MLAAGAGCFALAACGGANNHRTAAPATGAASRAAGSAAPSPRSGSPVAGPGGVSGAATAAAGQKPRTGGTLHAAIASDITPKTLPHTVSPTNDILSMCVYDTLIRYQTDQLIATPELAESWEFNADKSQLSFHLKKGVTFHNGKPLTAAAVQWNIQRVGQPEVGSQLLNFAKWVTKAETPDDTTLTLTFDQPRPSIMDMFESLFIVEPDSIQDTMDGKRFVGTGPFTFKEWQPGDHYSFTKNASYFKAGQPYLDGIESKIIPDAQTQLINVQSGTADIAFNVALNDAKQLQSDKKYQVIVPNQWTGLWYVGIDVKAAGLGDRRVRQAIAYAMDRKRMVDTALFGFGQVTVLPWAKNSPAYDPALAGAYTYDLAKAKQLLAAAGAASLDLSYTVSNAYPSTHPIAEILQGDLNSIGVKTEITRLDHPVYLPKLTGGKMNGLWSGVVGFMYMSPSTLFVQSFPYRVPNSSNFDSPEYRQLIAQTLSAPEAQLPNVYHQLNQLLIDEAFMLPITPSSTPAVANGALRDWLLSRSSRPVLEAVWLNK